MKISRWIYFPLIYTILYISLLILLFSIFGLPFDSFLIWVWLIYGVLMGFLFLYISNRKAKKLSKNGDERVFDVRQNRNLILLLDYERAFNLCREAILALKKGKIKSEDFQEGEIKGVSRLKWDIPKQKIEIRLKKINDNLTEVELFVRPGWKTIMVSSGYSWRGAEDICSYLKEKDTELNKKVLVDSAQILDDVYVKPFQKEKIGNMKA